LPLARTARSLPWRSAAFRAFATQTTDTPPGTHREPLTVNPIVRTALAVAVLALSIPAAQAARPAAAPAGFDPHRIGFKPGAYRCELGRSVHVRHVSADMQTATLHWNRRDYTVRAVDARSGALRYEDRESGLVWLMIHGKSMLLDGKQGQRLADACRA
jgi:hypothetical protein